MSKTMTMKTTETGRKALQQRENCRLKSYLCSAKVWTIGYGNTYYEDGTKVKEGDVITQDRANKLFDFILPSYEKIINTHVKVLLTAFQFDALLSFVYNIGEPNFKGSTLLRELNKGNYKKAAAQLQRFNQGPTGYLVGLQNRRVLETEQFLGEGY
jgi:lysozyme